MKNFLPLGLIAVLLLSVLLLNAQPRIGIQVGYGLSMSALTLAQEPNFPTSTTSETGFVGGIFGQIPLKKNWVFRPVLQFVNKGYKERYSSQSYAYSTPVPLRYFEVPLSFVYTTLPGRNGFLLGGGPTVSFSSDRDYQYRPVKSLDAGAHVLLGFQTPLGFSANLTYTHGFVNVSKFTDQVPVIKNRFAALTVGYLF